MTDSSTKPRLQRSARSRVSHGALRSVSIDGIGFNLHPPNSRPFEHDVGFYRGHNRVGVIKKSRSVLATGTAGSLPRLRGGGVTASARSPCAGIPPRIGG